MKNKNECIGVFNSIEEAVLFLEGYIRGIVDYSAAYVGGTVRKVLDTSGADVFEVIVWPVEE